MNYQLHKLASYSILVQVPWKLHRCVPVRLRADSSPWSNIRRNTSRSIMSSAVDTEGVELAPGQTSKLAKYNGKEYEVVQEGLATILNPRRAPNTVDKGKPRDAGMPQQAVFYNPIQQFNRDLSVLAIRIFAGDLARIRKARRERQAQGNSNKAGKGKKRKREGADSEGRRAKLESAINGQGKQEEVFQAEAIEGSGEYIPTAVNSEGNNSTPPAVLSETISPEVPEAHTFPESTDEPSEIAQERGSRDVKAEEERDDKDKRAKVGTFRILDALSATGLRALRYAKEIPEVTSVVANDLSEPATASIKLNVLHNELGEKVHATTGNALTHMYRVASDNQYRLPDGQFGKYDVIDLDPYGTAALFLDAAVQALCDGGLLCVTCTDSGVFASVGYLEKTFSQYGGLPFKGTQSHEAGLRLILHTIATSAARYGIAIEPLLSLSIDFYARVFVRIRKSAAEVKFLAGKTMLVYNCDQGCGAWTTQFLAQNKVKKDKKDGVFYKFALGQAPSASPNCEHCGFKTHLSGPMWGGPLHNPHFIQRVLDLLPSLSAETYTTIPRIEGMLSTALEETLLDSPSGGTSDAATPETKHETSIIPSLDPAQPDHYPFFVIPSVLAKVLHCTAPSYAAICGAFLGLGYRATRSHTKPGSVRTDAPWSVIWEVMREWVRQKAPLKEGALKKGTPGWGIMRHDRSQIRMQELQEQLRNVMEKADNLESTKTEIEAALYRTSKGAERNGTEEAVRAPREGGPVHELDIVFDEDLGRDPSAKRLVRYQLNPRANWGPMARAKGGHAHEASEQGVS
jgi:tRNA (guanine26-N2/guanine27-N2)-dimethyltransferase